MRTGSLHLPEVDLRNPPGRTSPHLPPCPPSVSVGHARADRPIGHDGRLRPAGLRRKLRTSRGRNSSSQLWPDVTGNRALAVCADRDRLNAAARVAEPFDSLFEAAANGRRSGLEASTATTRLSGAVHEAGTGRSQAPPWHATCSTTHHRPGNNCRRTPVNGSRPRRHSGDRRTTRKIKECFRERADESARLDDREASE